MRFINGQLEVPDWNTCPRCGSASLETLRTHSYCIDCNYSPVPEPEVPIPSWVHEYIQSTSKGTVDGDGLGFRTGQVLEAI